MRRPHVRPAHLARRRRRHVHRVADGARRRDARGGPADARERRGAARPSAAGTADAAVPAGVGVALGLVSLPEADAKDDGAEDEACYGDALLNRGGWSAHGKQKWGGTLGVRR